jgi:hypothetical protein
MGYNGVIETWQACRKVKPLRAMSAERYIGSLIRNLTIHEPNIARQNIVHLINSTPGKFTVDGQGIPHPLNVLKWAGLELFDIDCIHTYAIPFNSLPKPPRSI